MFSSISRRKVKLRSTYICTSCLSNLFPHDNQHPTRQIPNHSSFSTTSKRCNEASEGARKPGGRLRRGRSSPTSISHSRDTLSELKLSLQAEELESKPTLRTVAKTAPTSSSKSPAKTGTTKKNELSGPKNEVEGTNPKLNAKTKAKPQTKSNLSKGVTKSLKSTGNGEAEIEGSIMPKITRPIIPAKKPALKATKKAPKVNAKSAELEDGPQEDDSTPSKSRKRTPKQSATTPTDVQRQKVEALLLGLKNKQEVILGKDINTHIRGMDEDKVRDALVKRIEDGNETNSKASIRKILSTNTGKKVLHLKASTETVDDGKAKTKGVSIQESPSLRPVSPNRNGRPDKRRLGKNKLVQRCPPTLVRRPPPRLIIRRPVSKVSTSIKAAMTAKLPRRKAGEGIVTGPLKEGDGFEIETLDASDLELIPIIKAQPQVPSLSYGLERVLFNPGVYQLQDPRSRVFNFDPYLQKIMPITEFDFAALKQYVTSSRDDTLLATAREVKKKYTGSTSSTTAALAHFHFLLSQWRPINTETLSRKFPVEYETFTALQRGPSAVFLRWKDGVYAIDADKQFDSANVLMSLGKSMEKLLTLPTNDFEKYRKRNSDQISTEEREAAEAFNYTTIGDFLLRSQLDAHDPRLPGTGMFDLKTRAVVSIRMDVSEYEQGRDYEIRDRHGEWESYEREYYDMIRAAFLKYSLQVRMGRMDGIFVAFHNTQRIFGFQYVSLPELDLALHGSTDTTTGDSEFKMSLELLNKVLDRATAKYPEKSIRLHFETRNTKVPFMYIFAEPMEDEEITKVQEANKAVIEDFESRVLGLEAGDESEGKKKAAEWASLRSKVEESMEEDELDIEEARNVAETLIDESPLFSFDELSGEEKEKLIDDLLEAVMANEEEGGEAIEKSADEQQSSEGVEGAAAEFEGDDDDGEVDDEAGEDEENEIEEDENEEEQEDENEEAEFTEEVDHQLEETDNLEPVDEAELLDDAPRDNPAEATDALMSDSIDVGPIEGDDQLQNAAVEETSGSVEPSDETDLSENPEEADNGASDDVAEPVDDSRAEYVENPDLAPFDENLAEDTGETDSSEEGEDLASYSPLSSDASNSNESSERIDNTEVLAMTLTIRNKVNGEYVARPEKLTARDKWTIEYALADVPEKRSAQALYVACKTRRKTALSFAKRENSTWGNSYLEKLKELSRKGKEYRQGVEKVECNLPIRVLDGKAADTKAWMQNKSTEAAEEGK